MIVLHLPWLGKLAAVAGAVAVTIVAFVWEMVR
jgi:hypothetical protein